MIESLTTFQGTAVFLIFIWTILQWIDAWPQGRRVAFTWGGLGVGALFGYNIGLASGGEGISADVLLSPLCAWIGYLLEPSISRSKK